MSQPQIILASQSIGRWMLLEKLGIPFSVQVTGIDEDIITSQNPFEIVQRRSRKKAEHLLKKLSTKPYTLNSIPYLIIAADSEAILDGKTYGKSPTKQKAREIVRGLMGKTHTFATGNRWQLHQRHRPPI